ncbi:MAG: ankyrin repeat domain-containing protein [Burkholderiales bacterium]|nr:ankyrin repeat domain-containing protein [Burkholderiales bacterium]
MPKKILLLIFTFAISLSSCAAPSARDEALKRRAEREEQTRVTERQESDIYNRFFDAVSRNRAGEVRALINKGIDPETVDRNGETALMVAARAGNDDVINTLLTMGAKVDSASAYGDTALMVAALSGHRSTVELLLKQGASVSRKGWTPMHYAATGGHNEIIAVLFDYLADLNARAPNGTTPLMMAVRQGHPATVKLLIDLGADVNLRNDSGASAMDWAIRGSNEEIRAYLQQQKAN